MLRLKAIALTVAIFSMTACLQTRNSQKENEEKQVMQKQVQNLQGATADVNQRFQEVDEDVRKINGRVEVIEAKYTQSVSKNEKLNVAHDAKLKEVTDKMAIYQEAITKLDNQVTQLTTELTALKEENKKLAEKAAEPPSKSSGKVGGHDAKELKDEKFDKAEKSGGPLTLADDNFDKRKWKEAALEYEKYRKNFPKGSRHAHATYRIGVSFQELGAIDDAKAFYEEVVSKFPKSPEAQKAGYRLKSFKK